MQKDRKKNNFLHLISKNFIYKEEDIAHPNYEYIISNKLDKFIYDKTFVEVLNEQVYEKNYTGISPLKLALD